MRGNPRVLANEATADDHFRENERLVVQQRVRCLHHATPGVFRLLNVVGLLGVQFMNDRGSASRAVQFDRHVGSHFNAQ